MFIIVRQEKPQDSKNPESPQSQQSPKSQQSQQSGPHIGFVKFHQNPEPPKLQQAPKSPKPAQPPNDSFDPSEWMTSEELESAAPSDLVLSAVVKLIHDLKETRARLDALRLYVDALVEVFVARDKSLDEDPGFLATEKKRGPGRPPKAVKKPAKKGKSKAAALLAILGLSGLLMSGGCGFFEYDPTLPPLTPTPPGSVDWMGAAPQPTPTPVGDR